ncbi:hypothetical protein QAD02_000472 [Eretmocerus hayati]|uniref:Uncharacterized protein n=1 Tax=Eretmocerus hayati TaxID=131215 RepID=A0ACC2NEK5_9HYME|nr:hypothetical protein QAD02_000472 [Eretmocerus hayati]
MKEEVSMVNYCIVPRCKTNRVGGATCSVFQVPKDLSVREKWQQILGSSHLKAEHKVCAKHFQCDDVVTYTEYLDEAGNRIYKVSIQRKPENPNDLSNIKSTSTNTTQKSNAQKMKEVQVEGNVSKVLHKVPIIGENVPPHIVDPSNWENEQENYFSQQRCNASAGTCVQINSPIDMGSSECAIFKGKNSAQSVIESDPSQVAEIALDTVCIHQPLPNYNYCFLIANGPGISCTSPNGTKEMVEAQNNEGQSERTESESLQTSENDGDKILIVPNKFDEVQEYNNPPYNDLNSLGYRIYEHFKIEPIASIKSNALAGKIGKICDNIENIHDGRVDTHEHAEMCGEEVQNQPIHQYGSNLASSMTNSCGIESTPLLVNESDRCDFAVSFDSNGNKEVSSDQDIAISENMSNDSGEPKVILETHCVGRNWTSCSGPEKSQDCPESVCQLNTNPAKKRKLSGKQRQPPLCDEPYLAPGHDGNSIMVRRQSPRCLGRLEKSMNAVPGKLVWGYFSPLWWPALVVKAEDIGMLPGDETVWVHWIGESRISELTREHIDLFTNKLEERLDRSSNHDESKPSIEKLKETSCLQLIKLLKNRLPGGASEKPNASWLGRNMVPRENQLGELVFYPYPVDCRTCLDDIREKNSIQSKRCRSEM